MKPTHSRRSFLGLAGMAAAAAVGARRPAFEVSASLYAWDLHDEGITLGHYDSAEFPMLRAIRDGLKDTGKLG